MTALVTGASGHLGGTLVRALLAQGRTVRALVHSSSEALKGIEGQLELVKGDVLDRESIDRACEGVETVFHLAAIISIVGDPDGRVRAVNVDGARNVAEAALAAGVTRMVHVSSCHAFDINSGAAQINEESPKVGDGAPAYDRSKAAGEEAVREVIVKGLQATIVNPGGVLGPFDFIPSRMGTFFLRLFGRRLPGLVPGGFSWVDVRDVVDSIIAAETKGRVGENYLLTGHWGAMTELAGMAQAVTGVKSPGFSVPLWVADLAAPLMTIWAKLTKSEPLYTREALHAVRACHDISWQKAGRELGHSPRPLQDTVRDTYRWFEANGRVTLPEDERGSVSL
ncbi:MAG: NAD-dependent epimerase/dehydratase family protein [Myxococcota bacterium]